jgi:hypothetical protein
VLREAVSEHIVNCASCRELMETYEGLRDAVRFETRPRGTNHPDSKDLVEYALWSETLPAARRDEIASHVTSCDDCESEIVTVREAEHESRNLQTGTSSVQGRELARAPWLHVWAVAASLLVALLVYPAWLGWSRGRTWPSKKDEGEVRGLAALVLLGPENRGAAGRPVVHLAPDTSTVVILVEPVMLPEDPESGLYSFQLLDAGGRPLHTWKASVSEVRHRATSAFGIVPFSLDVSLLRPGRYTLAEVGPDGLDRLRRDFDVVAGASGSPSAH